MSLDVQGVTDSKASISTGLQRREIARLRKEDASLQTARQPLAEIIALWWDDAEYDPKGIPVNGEEASFASLARRIRKDVHPRTFLDILIEIGAVSESGDMVQLNTRIYQPLPGSDDQMAYLAANVGDHLEAAVSNVVDKANHYDMCVHYEGLSQKALEQLNSHFRTRMRLTLEELDTMARAFPTSENGTHRFRAGGYFFDDIDHEAQSNDP